MIIDFKELGEHFLQAASKFNTNDIDKVLSDELVQEFIAAWYRRFDSQTNSDGSPWSSDLVDTGELRASIEVLVGNQRIEAGPSGARNEDLAIILADKGNVVGGIDDELDDKISRVLDNFMYEALNQ